MQIGPPALPWEKDDEIPPTRIIQRKDPTNGHFITVPIESLKPGDTINLFEPDGRLMVDKYGRYTFIVKEEPELIDSNNVHEYVIQIEHTTDD